MDIKNVVVLGTGTMGHGIVQICAQAGLNVVMYGRSDESLNRGFNNIKSSLNRLKESNKITEDERSEILNKINGICTWKETWSYRTTL